METINKNDHKDHADLTSGEIASLWNLYEYETIVKCGVLFFLQHVEDEQIEELLQISLETSNERIQKIEEILTVEGYPIPKGFKDADVNLKAPRLFSDVLYLEFLLKILKFELLSYSMGLMEAVKLNIMEFYSETLKVIQENEIQTKELAKKKGIYIRSPRVPTPTQVEFVKKESFLAGWFGSKRPLLAMEISHLVFHAKRNALGQAVITAFSQVAKSKEVRRYFARGREISGKHLDIFTSILHDEYLPNATVLLTSEVTDSTEAPFSDKLMMTFITILITMGIAGYGSALSMSPRRDLGVMYTRLMGEIALYAEDGAEILIQNGWLEQPPMAADRKGLAK